MQKTASQIADQVLRKCAGFDPYEEEMEELYGPRAMGYGEGAALGGGLGATVGATRGLSHFVDTVGASRSMGRNVSPDYVKSMRNVALKKILIGAAIGTAGGLGLAGLSHLLTDRTE